MSSVTMLPSAMVLRLLLTTEGHDVVTHGSAVDFLADVDCAAIGCIVTDAAMPEMTGIELLLKVKTMALSPPVVVISGSRHVPLAVQEITPRSAGEALHRRIPSCTAVRQALAYDSGKRARDLRGRRRFSAASPR